MSFQRHLLPNAMSYFEEQGLKITGSKKGKWFTTECHFHGGSDSMRVNQATGGWVCMACGAKGGDLISYEMHLTGDDFITAAKRLGAWINDGTSSESNKPLPFSKGLALEVLNIEANHVLIAAENVAYGVVLTDVDIEQLRLSAVRIRTVVEATK